MVLITLQGSLMRPFLSSRMYDIVAGGTLI